ncbi:MAG: rhamnogalacturonan lyase [Bacteroidales bacterium]|nr:rhamnogalacturonan lyase [Bacteroidales bacterium]
MRNNSHWKHILHTVLAVALMATVTSCARTVRPTRQNVAMTGDYTKQAESGQNNAQDQRQGPGAQQGQPGQQGPQGQRQAPPQGQGAQQAARRIITPNLVQSDQARKEYTALPAQVPARQLERLGRGVVAILQDDGKVFVSWRLLADDPAGIAFNIYRKTGTAKAVKLNSTPIADVTWYLDGMADITQDNAWYVTSLVNGKESEGSASFSIAAHSPARPYLSIPLQTLEGYSPSDASAGDLDGDGEYEIVVKQVRREYDNSQRGVCTGTTKLEAYKLDGTFMWRIDLGPNIREGAHYTQFMVYDFDGDGKAEIICKTGEGTIDGTGKVIGDTDGDGITNYVNQTTGYILDGPEFFSVFEGATGKELARADYIARGPKEEWDRTWGDSYGNRIDRYLAGVGYFDGERPSVLLCRGYYSRAVLEAWNWRDGKLTRLWRFDSDDESEPGNRLYRGQGNHNLSIADVDNDGKDEVIYGACAIDDNGKGLYTTRIGHGDALHVSDLDPDRPGLEVFQPHESSPNSHGIEFRDARTGESLWGYPSTGDIGRGLAIDIDPRYRGSECWGSGYALYTAKGEKISDQTPNSTNFAVWWDGDLLRELLDRNTVSKWDWENSRTNPLLVANGCRSNNGTKATPALSADIFGDWREEVILATNDNQELRIFTTTIPTEYRFYTFMHDFVYRLGIAWQNTAYNQPPHVSFFVGDGPAVQPKNKFYYAE